MSDMVSGQGLTMQAWSPFRVILGEPRHPVMQGIGHWLQRLIHALVDRRLGPCRNRATSNFLVQSSASKDKVD
jgi:hypothetical protein